MYGGIYYGKVEGLVSVERWSCSRGASCVAEHYRERLRDWPPEEGSFLQCRGTVHFQSIKDIQF